MKKLVLLFTLIPLLSWAFPVRTNSYTFDPAQSSGSFDDFLFRWSGFDDQSVEFLFKDVTVSNVGFRLAYPQRGRTFLDVLPPKTTNTSVVVTNEVLDVYTNFYPAIYNRVTDRGFTNITETLNYSNGVFLSRSAVTNSFKVGSVQNTSLVLPAANLVYTQNAAVANTEAYGQFANAYVQSQNTTITVSNFLENARFNVFLGDSWLNSDYQPSSVSPNEFIPSGFGYSVVLTSSYSVVSGKYYSITGSVRVAKISSAVPDSSTRAFDVFAEPSGKNVLTIWGGYVGSALTFNFESGNFIATNSGTLLLRFSERYTGKNLTNNVYSINNLYVAEAGKTNLYKSVSTNIVTLASSNSVEFAFPSTQRVSRIYSKTEIPYSKVTFSVPRTNIPPDGPYFAEVLTYTAGGITNPGQSRTLAKGQVTIENSIYSITNYAGYTNYPGPWSYLLQDGSRPMSGNLNMGGNAVTNIGTNGLRFASGAYITPTDVATWNSFISSTSGLNAGTVFGGDVTGTYNNLTLRKNALDNMEFVDFTTAPTGTAEIGRMVWNTGRDTVRLGLNANVNLDVGQQLILYARNEETNTLAKGEVVYIAGAQGDNPTIKRASNASEALSARTIGIMAESVAVNGSGSVVTRGTIYGLNTTNFTQGANLYLGVNGTLQTNLPAAPTHGVFIGVVERVSANAGQIYVAIQNYQELEELSDVNVRGVATNDFIIWNGTVWTNYARTNLNSIYLPLAGGTMSGSINMQAESITGDGMEIYFNPGVQGLNNIDSTPAIFTGGWAFDTQPTIPGYQTIAGSVNAANLTNLSAIAGSGLDVSAGQLVVTSSAANASTWSQYPATQTVNVAANNITNVARLAFTTNGTASVAPSLYVSGTTLNYHPTLAGSPSTVWHSGNLNLFSYLTISQGNSNYWRITTAPTNATESGQRGQLAVSSSNVFIYNPDALGTGTGRWIRIQGSISWP